MCSGATTGLPTSSWICASPVSGIAAGAFVHGLPL